MTESKISDPSELLTSQTEPASPNFKGLFGKTTLLLVSPNEIPFVVHDAFLCRHSAFFRTALCGPNTYLETETRKVHLPEESPEEIECLLQWMYSGNLSHLNPPAIATSSKPAQATARYRQLFELYFLADRLLIPQLRNDVIGAVATARKELGRDPSINLIQLVYERFISPSNPLRSLLVDMKMYSGANHMRKHASEFPKEFLADLVGVMMEPVDYHVRNMTGGMRPWDGDLKKYHHESLD
ncbi:MAG: hypothetical protein M1816_000467 [Peltula sp. TS41687]|nr:MAG: hypothetical protein M1816_000467 [Peltula sp. TS41687]